MFVNEEIKDLNLPTDGFGITAYTEVSSWTGHCHWFSNMLVQSLLRSSKGRLGIQTKQNTGSLEMGHVG